MIYQKGVYPVTGVVLHTSATPGNWYKGKTVEEMRDEIRRWHVQGNGWSDIGYHRVFAPDGSMALGRSIYRVGAHVKERNRGTVGICMINNKTHKGIKNFGNYFTEAQRRAVKDYIRELNELTDIRWVAGHNDFTNSKECPGFRVMSEEWLER